MKKILKVAALHFEEQSYGRKDMAANRAVRRNPAPPRLTQHKIITTDAEIDRAIERARALQNEPRVTRVEYRPGPGLDLLILKLSDGRRQVIPREDLQGLQSAAAEQIARVEILGHGTGLHWPDLDLDLYVPSLLRRVYGSSSWMSAIGRRGGSAKGAAKKRAARANGLKGGRPRNAGALKVVAVKAMFCGAAEVAPSWQQPRSRPRRATAREI